ncbi:glycoside hydrolase family 16 protein [Dichomitus squalens]|uniref:Glycoside hydrolase family 16 protein n=1 Tax=Dichomitus squalens TaxID=114155 RepID=A0A4Q9Q8G6_9APHY|nr:glycoside hydrolase family 16 protein [Dichomitus squalens LYAD-421 SS1]EJF66804.1 glycoside hydrolase family 16 protein [Dichomitus squalens LYAD-421 SS1]TBU49859.1 glycoside hydrolase family 16 protein [Dichomitus squalens]TBU63832.1 glycoside hydrolase family 16 protein [Dichomitus squalens]
MASQTRQTPYAQSAAPSTASLLGPSTQSVRADPRLRSVGSSASLNDSRYVSSGRHDSMPPSLSDKFSLAPDPTSWGADLSVEHQEGDDYLHNPDPRRDYKSDKGGHIFTSRGLANLGCLLILCAGMLTLFAGYPLITYFTRSTPSTLGGFNLGGINASGQIPSMPGNWGMIDIDTPQEARTYPDFQSGKNWHLIFSDEFNTDGRTFYPGDDPYWEAVDLHYWQTNNMEWYDPEAITTRNGSLEITLSQKENHGLNYTGGMMSTWNKFCFTGGMVLASVVLPGINNVVGLWPAIWTMGNLGRAGYGASLEGMWPYTYDSCDVGTAPNQTFNGLPIAATNTGTKDYNYELSYLPGQKLSRCTCPGESHPGPVHTDGTYVGRSAPEIDIFEAQITGQPLTGQVSQSAQWAPFNEDYTWFNTTDNLIIPDPTISALNGYKGAAFQQASSVVTETNQEAYELTGNQYSTYGIQYKPGFDGAYISWISDGKLAWTLKQAGFAADTVVEIGPRPVPQEPMYLIANLGMSTNFGFVDIEHLKFPTTMKVDWIRVYQDPDNINVGCDPSDFPTAAYINEYLEAYTNPNLTTWRDDFKQPFPKNSFLGQC